MRVFVTSCLVLIGAASSLPAQTSDPVLARSLSYLPDSINAVAIARVQDVLHSPRAQLDEWEKKHPGEFLAGGLPASSAVNLVVRGLQFHLEDSSVTESVSVVSFARAVSMSRLAEHENGHVETIAGKSAVHSPQRGYFVSLERNVIGNMQPSYRQNVSRWLQAVEDQATPRPPTASAPLSGSPYLQEVQEGDYHVLAAVDLTDAVDPHVLRERLASFSRLVDQPKEQEFLAKLLERLRGIRLTLTVTDKIEAKISVDFGSKPSSKLAEYIKPLLIEVLGRAGASIDELEAAQSQVEGNAVALTMTLSDASARHILSLAFSTSADVPSDPEPGASEASAEDRTLAATKNYFTSVNRLIDDLQTKAQRSRNYQQTVAFHESYAKRIDQLAVRDVDRDVLEYAAGISSKLRALAVSLKGVPLTINRLQNSITYDVQYTPWAFGVNIWGGIGYRPPAWQYNTNQGQIQAQQAEAIAAGEQNRQEVWKMIADDRQAIRLKLREKYNVDFE